jgi:hypothetical protein
MRALWPRPAASRLAPLHKCKVSPTRNGTMKSSRSSESSRRGRGPPTRTARSATRARGLGPLCAAARFCARYALCEPRRLHGKHFLSSGACRSLSAFRLRPCGCRRVGPPRRGAARTSGAAAPASRPARLSRRDGRGAWCPPPPSRRGRAPRAARGWRGRRGRSRRRTAGRCARGWRATFSEDVGQRWLTPRDARGACRTCCFAPACPTPARCTRTWTCTAGARAAGCALPQGCAAPRLLRRARSRLTRRLRAQAAAPGRPAGVRGAARRVHAAPRLGVGSCGATRDCGRRLAGVVPLSPSSGA